MKKIELYLILLGVGLGILFSGIALKIVPRSQVDYSDQEIVEKARSLGMVGIKENIENNENEAEKLEEEKNKLKKEAEAIPSPKNKQADEPNEVEISILRGEVSGDISKKLFSKGLIADQTEFEKFISSEDADNHFREGTYIIKEDSDYRTILSTLTKGVH